jgi:triacylglycerol esterase/lipase EstA (alpha/beta hydrolase family)
VPALLVHGIWNTRENFATMRTALEVAGVNPVLAIDLAPNNGSVPIATLASQVNDAAERLSRDAAVDRIDVVGFSMGALVTRYWIQRGGGRARVRRFVSISGPHAGTANAYALPFAGVREMRPGSTLLRDLSQDTDPWGAVEVHCFWTPFDLMIVPARSGVLAGARTVKRVPVAMHRWMVTDPRVIREVVALLRTEP